MADQSEQRIKERAYHLWQKEGSPEGRDGEFWERARLMLEAESAAPIATPLGQRSLGEKKADEAAKQSFPASDPPSFTATTGTRTK
jgi:hypothetical protein